MSLLIFIDNDTRDRWVFFVDSKSTTAAEKEELWDLETRGEFAAEGQFNRLFYNVGFDEGLSQCKENVPGNWTWNGWGAVEVTNGFRQPPDLAVSWVHIFHLDGLAG